MLNICFIIIMEVKEMGYTIESGDVFVGKRKFREEMPRLIEEAKQASTKIIITDRGEPEAVCMSIEEYEALNELIEDLHDRNVLMMVSKSRKEIESGDVFSIDELKEFLEVE